MKTSKLARALLLMLLTFLVANRIQEATLGQVSASGSSMISGVLAHEMTGAEAQLLANSNITWVSCDVTFDPSDISQWSQVYSLAKQYHLNLLGILDQHLMNYSDTFTLSDWSKAVTQAVNAYGNVVKTWEIWNEPNFSNNTLGYFNGFPQSYVTMLQTAYNDIRAIAPSDMVIGLGGMPLYDSENTTIDYYTQQALTWAGQVVQLGGMNYCNAIAVHAYPYGQYYPEIQGSLFTSNLKQYEQLCPGKPIWVTEVGQESYSTTWDATESQQSTFLQESYSLFQGLGVAAYIWYELNDNYTAIPNSNFGLFDNNGNPKEAWTTFVDAVNALPTSTPASTTTPMSPTQTPTISPSLQPPALTPPASTPKPVPEENFAVALIVCLALSVAAAASTCLKKRRVKRHFSL